MNAFSPITPALCEAADDREVRAAAYLIERYLNGLRVAIRNAVDRCQREEARQAQAKVRFYKNAIAAGQRFAATQALISLGPNMHGPWIDTVIAAGERRSAARDADKED